MTQGGLDSREEGGEETGPQAWGLTTYRQLPVVKDTAQVASGIIHLRLILLQQRNGVFYLGVVLL